MSQTRINISPIVDDNIDPRLETLESEHIFAFSEKLSTAAVLLSQEEARIMIGGVTEGEQPILNKITRTRLKLEGAVRNLGAIAFQMRATVELAEYNQEVIKSTEELQKAAKNIKKMRKTIDNFVKAADILIEIAGTISSGGALSFSGIFSTVSGLLS